MSKIKLHNRSKEVVAVALIDSDDFSLVSKYKWSLMSSGYVQARINGKVILLHSFLIGEKEGYIIDHLNRNKLDNRRENLRFATYSQNAMNHGKNAGVFWSKQINKWRAYICFQPYKRTYLGCFGTQEEALMARKEAEKIYV